MHKSLLIISALAAGLSFGEPVELTRGEFKLTYTTCPQCPFRARFTPDGKQAFLNTSKVPEKDRVAMTKRLFALMNEAATAPHVSTTNEPNVFLDLLRTKGGNATGMMRFLSLRNDQDVPHIAKIVFADLNLAGNVQILDLGDCADLGNFSKVFETILPPHTVRHFRLDAEKR